MDKYILPAGEYYVGPASQMIFVVDMRDPIGFIKCCNESGFSIGAGTLIRLYSGNSCFLIGVYRSIAWHYLSITPLVGVDMLRHFISHQRQPAKYASDADIQRQIVVYTGEIIIRSVYGWIGDRPRRLHTAVDIYNETCTFARAIETRFMRAAALPKELTVVVCGYLFDLTNPEALGAFARDYAVEDECICCIFQRLMSDFVFCTWGTPLSARNDALENVSCPVLRCSIDTLAARAIP